jgi:hypothetical protein
LTPPTPGQEVTSVTSLGALCSDFYVNQKISLKMDLPSSRESVLDLFDRVRKVLPTMDRFRRYDGELALESSENEPHYTWLALGRTAIRSGWVNPESLDEAYRLHRLLLQVAPYYLSISPLDVDSVELVFGFDIEAETNRNQVVFDALMGDSPLTGLIDGDREEMLDAQPFVGFSLSHRCDVQAFVEVKTRTRSTEVASGHFESEPISIYLTVRRYGPFQSIDDFETAFGGLAGHAERLAEERVIPAVLLPIRSTLMAL